MGRRPVRVPAPRSSFAGFRFPPDVITIAVRWYLRYGLSYRDVEELLAERGVEVDHVTIFRWVQRFTPLLIDAARPCRHMTGDRWFVDETYAKIAGRWVYLVCPGSCDGLAGESPAGVAAKRPRSWWPAEGEIRLSKRHDKVAVGGEQVVGPYERNPVTAS